MATAVKENNQICQEGRGRIKITCEAVTAVSKEATSRAISAASTMQAVDVALSSLLLLDCLSRVQQKTVMLMNEEEHGDNNVLNPPRESQMRHGWFDKDLVSGFPPRLHEGLQSLVSIQLQGSEGLIVELSKTQAVFLLPHKTTLCQEL